MKKVILLPLLALLLAAALPARGVPSDAEERLASARGRERLALLVELATRDRESAPDQALRWAKSGEPLARTLGDDEKRALLLEIIGDVYRFRNDYDPALEAYDQARQLYEKVGDLSGLAEVLKGIGILHRLVSDYASALDFYLRAHAVFERAGDRAGAAAVLNSMGIVHMKLSQTAEAEEYYRRAAEIQRQEGNERQLAMVLNNLGILKSREEKPQEALEHFRASLEIKERLGNRRGLAYTYDGIGRCYRQLGRYDEALGYFARSLALREELGEKKGMASVLLETGTLHQQRGDAEQSLADLRRALVLAEEIDAKDFQRGIHFQLAATYEHEGRYREALRAFRTFEEVSREGFDEDNRRRINEMQVSFEAERKEKEIEILRQKEAIQDLELERQRLLYRALLVGLGLLLVILVLLYNRYRLKLAAARLKEDQARREERERYIEELEAKNAEVEAKNAEMERFTYTVSHDLKSPLVTIQGFLGLLRRDVGRNPEQALEDVERIQDAAGQMGQLLEELLELSRVGRVAHDPEPVCFVELARGVAELLAPRLAEANARLEIAPDLPPARGDRPRLREVLQNLLENATKYSRREPAPRLEVGWRRDAGEAVYFVRDNGIGIEPRYHEKVFELFERLDVDAEGTGVGLALVKRIIEWHGGRIWIESAGAGQGTTVCFTVPSAGPG